MSVLQEVWTPWCFQFLFCCLVLFQSNSCSIFGPCMRCWCAQTFSNCSAQDFRKKRFCAGQFFCEPPHSSVWILVLLTAWISIREPLQTQPWTKLDRQPWVEFANMIECLLLKTKACSTVVSPQLTNWRTSRFERTCACDCENYIVLEEWKVSFVCIFVAMEAKPEAAACFSHEMLELDEESAVQPRDSCF